MLNLETIIAHDIRTYDATRNITMPNPDQKAKIALYAFVEQIKQQHKDFFMKLDVK